MSSLAQVQYSVSRASDRPVRPTRSCNSHAPIQAIMMSAYAPSVSSIRPPLMLGCEGLVRGLAWQSLASEPDAPSDCAHIVIQ